jgi:hypothetical protein
MEHRWPQHVKWIAGTAALIALAVVFWFSPTEYAFYPRCLFHALTGLDCPGCGALRSVHCLLHGQVTTAFQLNPLLYILAPAVFVSRKHIHKPVCLWSFVGVIVAFSVLRNI